MLWYWFRTQRLPDSVPCLALLRDSCSQAYVTRHGLTKPFGHRVANLMADLSIDPTPVSSFRLPRVGYWQLPVISLCPPAMDALWQRKWLTGVATSKMGEIITSTIPQWTYSHVRDRRAHTLLARLRIGHTYLTQRYMLTRDPQPFCDDCLVPLTVRHLIVECHSLTDLRDRYLYRCRGRDSDVYYSSIVLGPECLAQGFDVFEFLGEAGLLPKL
ncbi:hypothetical protein E2C01_038144 [Portunus trituberculatus]|uniref:Reverse transcriptase zinc-binding domain-containing protein n=1 Tax=Portunus trituberculatus TaxID=210409 RepID=A0A5B7FBF7_PORTR|nr:hypothetical protein [Portunus trituberculatus]